jgi:hypothetical protein
MAPRFRKADDSVEAAVRRIAAAQIDAAIAIIDDSQRTLEKKVHKVRRRLKALRALLRLVKERFTEFRAENRAFRDLGRALSGARDAHVMLETFDAISRRGDARPLPPGFVAARARLVAACAADEDMAGKLAQVRGELVAARHRIRHWSLAGHGWHALAPGLRKTYGEARRAMARARRTGKADASHEWRKGVKYHGDQLRLLRKLRPEALGSRILAAAQLAGLLGDRHDIDMFLERLGQAPAHFGDIVTVTELAGLARLHAARIDRHTRRLGESLFGARPRALDRHFGEMWQGWRDEDA